MPLAVRDQVGHDALVLAGEQSAGAGEAGLHLVGDEDDAVGPAELGHAGRKPGAGTMKPPSPWIGSMITAATFSAPTCLSIAVDRLRRRLLAARSGPVGQRNG